MRLILSLLLSLAAFAQPREATCTVVDTGGDDSYVGSCPAGTVSVRLLASTANTAAATLDIGAGAIAIKNGGSNDPENGAIPGNAKVVKLYFDGAYWQIEASGGVGGGSASVTGLYSGVLDFGSVPDGGCLQLTFTATGLTTGRALALAPPSGLNTGLMAMAYASAADTAAVRVCNLSGASVDPVSATFAVRDMQTLGYATGSAAINFGSITDGTCAADTITVTGAATGDSVAAGWPSTLEAGLSGSMFVSATDTVTVRLCNWSGAAVNPASQTFAAAVTK